MGRDGLRVLRSVLRPVCAVLLIAGLGSQARAETATVVLWHSFRGREEVALQKIVLAYELQNPERITLVQKDGGNFGPEVEAAVAAGRGPDLFVWAHDRIGVWAGKGVIRPIDELKSLPDTSGYLPSCLAAMVFRGRLYGLPFSFETLAMFYNRKLLPEPPRTTDEMIKALQALSSPEEDRYGLVYERGNFYHHAMWLHGFGGKVFDGDRFAVTDSESQRAIEFARDLNLVHRIIPDTVDWNRQMGDFNEGRAAILLSGPWAYGSIDRTKVDLGLATIPTVSATGLPAGPFLGVKGFYVNRRSRRAEAAVRVAAGLTSAYSGYVMNLMAGYLPAHRRSFEYESVRNDPITSVFKEQALTAVPMPSTPAMDAVWQAMISNTTTGTRGCLDAVLMDGRTARDATAAAEARFKQLRGSGR
jgi:arabinogalactan oligomer / maltooligosaccharide transport system permease protein